jgi:hypothetical protein
MPIRLTHTPTRYSVYLVGRCGGGNDVCFRQACVVEESGLFLCGFAATTSG